MPQKKLLDDVTLLQKKICAAEELQKELHRHLLQLRRMLKHARQSKPAEK